MIDPYAKPLPRCRARAHSIRRTGRARRCWSFTPDGSASGPWARYVHGARRGSPDPAETPDRRSPEPADNPRRPAVGQVARSGDLATAPSGDLATAPSGHLATAPSGDLATAPPGDLATAPVHDPDSRGIGTVRYPRRVPNSEQAARELANARSPISPTSAHQKLDSAVFAAYGWPDTLTDDEILEKLLALNLRHDT